MAKFKLIEKIQAWKNLGEGIMDERNIKYISTEVGKNSVCQDTGRLVRF